MGRPREHEHDRRDLAAHRRGDRDRSRGVQRRRRPGGRRRTARVRLRSVAADVARGARRRDGAGLRAHPGASRGVRAHDQRGDGLAHLVLGHGAGVRVDDGARLLHEPRPRVHLRGVPPGCARPGHGAPGAGGCRRLHRAVERPAVHDHVEAGPGDGVGIDGRAEARSRDAARRVPARRGARGGGPPGRGDQHRGGGPRGRRAPRDPSRRRQDRLHRVERGGQADRRPLRRAAQAVHARARREVGGDHPRRRRPRDGDPCAAAERDHEQRPGVYRADADPRVAVALRRRRGSAFERDGGDEGRCAPRSRDGGRPARGRAAA